MVVFSDVQNRMYLALYDPRDTGRIVVYGSSFVAVFSDPKNRMFLAFYDLRDTGRIVIYGPYYALRAVFNKVPNSSELLIADRSLRPRLRSVK